MKRTLIAVLVFALLFAALASWLGPRMIAYWYAPPVAAGAAAAFNCTEAVIWAMHKLIWTQVAGVAGGAVLGLVVGVLMRRRAPPPAPTAPAPPASPPVAPPTRP